MTDENGACRELTSRFLADRALIIAANRGPVTLARDDDGSLQFQRGGGGLVTALWGLSHEASNATWIASARTKVDSEWDEGEIQLDAETSIHVRFLTPDPAAYEGYYNVIANPLLWFLQHSMWDVPRAPVIDRETWQAWNEGYRVVNRLFADAIARQARANRRKTLVMLQDYHLYLVAQSLRTALRGSEQPTILHFVHIPWPGPEYWRILPPAMREAILQGLCSVDLLGFQTRDDGLDFLRTVDSLLPRASVNYRQWRVRYRNHTVHVHDFPISIDVGALQEMAASEEVAGYRQEIEQMTNGRQLLLRIDRIEPSKNIIRGFLAFEQLLADHPEHAGRVTFLALLVPSRLDLHEYQLYLDELMATAGRVNATYGNSAWEPVRVIVGDNYPRAVAAMQSYDVLLVNAIADGMNLVAKEGPVVNERDGVLILSERAGARQQLEPAALVVSPCDICDTSNALHNALTMGAEERAERAGKLRTLVEEADIFDWLCRQLEVVSELRL
ncbi:MAG TPA: trehalose-6-phosphate synthase [Anaerolineae bacterium]|nr:trehalose-6-phosphate synthase [Anaerolineae bacterium]